MTWTLSLSLTSELPFSHRNEREDPEEEQDGLTELLNSNKCVLFDVTATLETGTLG